jgi:ABC-type antimicrobial peptide transport system permease subunit
MYWPAAQIDAVPGDTLRRMRRSMTIAVATQSGDPRSIVPMVRAAVAAVDPDQPIARIRTMASLMTSSLWLSRAATWLMTVFGGAAFSFALLGVFGAASYAVTQRRRELAVRLALGAKPEKIARMVLTGIVASSIAGIVIGIALTLTLRQTLAALTVGIDSAAPFTLAVVALGLALAIVLVSWLPARRVASIEPAQALRIE